MNGERDCAPYAGVGYRAMWDARIIDVLRTIVAGQAAVPTQFHIEWNPDSDFEQLEAIPQVLAVEPLVTAWSGSRLIAAGIPRSLAVSSSMNDLFFDAGVSTAALDVEKLYARLHGAAHDRDRDLRRLLQVFSAVLVADVREESEDEVISVLRASGAPFLVDNQEIDFTERLFWAVNGAAASVVVGLSGAQLTLNDLHGSRTATIRDLREALQS